MRSSLLLPLILALGCAAPGASPPLAPAQPTASSATPVASAQAAPPDVCADTSDSEPAGAKPAADPQIARALDHYESGRYEDADTIVSGALVRLQSSTGETGKLIAMLRLSALLDIAKGRLPEAIVRFRTLLETSETWIRDARAGLTEGQLAAALSQLRMDEDLVYSLAADNPSNKEVAALALTFASLRKGRSAGEVTKTYGVFDSGAPGSTEAWTELKKLRRAYATAALLGAPAQDRAKLRKRSDELEAGLIRSNAFAQLASGYMDMAVQPSLVLGALGMNASMGNVFVDYEAFRRFRFGAPSKRPGWQDMEYLAMVLDNGEDISVISLGAAAAIDEAARTFVRALGRQDPGWEAASKSAFGKIFLPVQKVINRGDSGYIDQLVVISPDGELALLPFAALLDDKGPLLDRYRLSYVDTPRDLAFGKRRGLAASTSVQILAAPEFKATAPQMGAPGKDCGSLKISGIPGLPGTAAEATALQKLLPLAEVRTGAGASKSALLGLKSPGILHVATHGLFMDASAPSAGTRGLVLTTEPAKTGGERPALDRDPLVRSALLLAGEAGSSEGGLATALEIGAMDLSGTQLVVLSACDTGRGDVRVGQGVFGLRRAFGIAGARTVVTSLWKVDDQSTQQLMGLYYQALLDGEGKADAMRKAARALRKDKPHPYFWAPFVVSGSIDRLEGKAGAAIPAVSVKRGIEVTPVNPPQPVIIGPH
jgi:CHAT domain-containing protein